MPAGNNANYVTTQGCSTGLSIGCYVEAPDGWYYDGTVGYSYYISSYYVTSIDTAPCATPPPPPPSPPAITWTAVLLGRGTAGAGGSACSRAQNGITNTFYMDASTFDTSTMIASNSDGTGTPTDGYYSDGTVVRQSTGGGLGSSTNCNII